MAAVTLTQMRNHLRIVGTQDDADLTLFAERATRAAEKITGRRFEQTGVVEKHAGGGTALMLRAWPVISVTAVTENGTTLTAGTGYVVDEAAGIVYRAPDGATWAPGPVAVQVTITAGEVPDADAELGILELAKHLWDTQRGGTGLPRSGADDEWDPDSNAAITRRVKQLLLTSDNVRPGVG